MPPKKGTIRSIAVGPDLWSGAMSRAKEDGTSASAAIRAFLWLWTNHKLDLPPITVPPDGDPTTESHHP